MFGWFDLVNILNFAFNYFLCWGHVTNLQITHLCVRETIYKNNPLWILIQKHVDLYRMILNNFQYKHVNLK